MSTNRNGQNGQPGPATLALFPQRPGVWDIRQDSFQISQKVLSCLVRYKDIYTGLCHLVLSHARFRFRRPGRSNHSSATSRRVTVEYQSLTHIHTRQTSLQISRLDYRGPTVTNADEPTFKWLNQLPFTLSHNRSVPSAVGPDLSSDQNIANFLRHLVESYEADAMASSTPTPATADRHPFERKIDEVKASKTDINKLVMDYLITEGYPSAARKFASEANMSPKADFENIQERVEIRESIYKGDLQSAIEKINELNPELLDTNDALHFSLLRLQLVELIRAASTSTEPDALTPALEFAATHLAPRAPTDPQFLFDLERTMALLIFPPESWVQQQKASTTNPVSQSSNTSVSSYPATGQPSIAPNATHGALPGSFGPLAELIDPSLRRKVANDVNKAILQAQGDRREARIHDLVRVRAWSEKVARDKKIDLPDRLDLGLDSDVSPTEQSGRNGHATSAPNGAPTASGEDTVMA